MTITAGALRTLLPTGAPLAAFAANSLLRRLALGGLLSLTVPTLTAPPLGAACLMAVAGIAWGVCSLRGRRASEPLATNAASFALAVPLCLLMLPGFPGERWLTRAGLLLGVLAGGVASALGYVAWYAALRGLHATRAAVLQLLVPGPRRPGWRGPAWGEPVTGPRGAVPRGHPGAPWSSWSDPRARAETLG